MQPRPRQRRGVVLLIVVIILVMFMLIGMAFVILAGQFRRGATAAARRHLRSENPVKLADNVIYQLLRDTNPGSVDSRDRTVRSSLHGHSLLRDLYGNDGIIAYLPVNPTGTSRCDPNHKSTPSTRTRVHSGGAGKVFSTRITAVWSHSSTAR